MKPANCNYVLSIPCDQVGTLALIGVLGNVVTCIAINIRILDPKRFQRRLAMEFPLGNSIVTEPTRNPRKVTMAIFQHRFEGEIRIRRDFLSLCGTGSTSPSRSPKRNFFLRLKPSITLSMLASNQANNIVYVMRTFNAFYLRTKCAKIFFMHFGVLTLEKIKIKLYNEPLKVFVCKMNSSKYAEPVCTI